MSKTTNPGGPDDVAQAPVRLIPRPDAVAGLAAEATDPAHRKGPSLLDLMGTAVGQWAKVEVNLPGGPHAVADVHALEASVADFLGSCGFAPDLTCLPEAGSWYRKHAYRLARNLDSAALARVFRAALADLMTQSQSQQDLLPGARNAVVASLAPFPSAVLLLGCLLVVKSPTAGRPGLVVCPVAEDLRGRIAAEPEFLRDPAAVLAFLDQSPWLMPVPRWKRTPAPSPAPAT